jgi:glycosyltransferase 2 family protein
MDNRRNRVYITVSISIVLSIVLFRFFIKNVDINFLWTSVKTANTFFILISGLLLIVSHYLRAIRWTMLLKPIQSTIKITSSFTAILIGTLSNFIVPHVGEVIRCSVLKKMEQTVIELSIGTVIAERLLDTFCLILLLVFGLILNANALSLLPINVSLLNTTPVLIGALVVGVLIILGILFKNRLSALFSKSVRKKIIDVKKGLSTIRQVRHSSLFILLSVAIWALYFLSTYFLIKAIIPTEYVGFKVVLAVLIMSSIGWAGPTQGGIGTFHILVSKALIVNGFNVEISNMISLFLHTVFSSFDLIYGLLAVCFFYFFKGYFKRIPAPLTS